MIPVNQACDIVFEDRSHFFHYLDGIEEIKDDPNKDYPFV
jgi:adenine specific DNA methylase Mod